MRQDVIKRGQHDYTMCPKTGKCVLIEGHNCKCGSGKCVHYGGTFDKRMSCRYPEREANGTLHMFEK